MYKFTWGDECKPPVGIQANAVSGGGIDLKWKTAPAHTGYNVQYRPRGHGSWYTQNSFIDNTSIYELPGNTEIEYQLQSVCGGYQSEYSEIYAIKTKEEEKRNFSCGAGKGASTIINTTPKNFLNIADKFTAGGFTAMITKISGQDGTFTGECNVLVPFFNFARVPHHFDNIKINELNQMYEGKLVSIYNPNSIFVARIGDGKNKAQENAEEATAKETNPADTVKTSDKTISDNTIKGGTTETGNAQKDSVTGIGSKLVNNINNTNVTGTGNNSVAGTSDKNTGSSISSGGNNGPNTGNQGASSSGGNSNGNTPSGNNTPTVPVNVKFAVQPSLLKIGFGQNIPVDFSIGQDLKDITNAKVEFSIDNPVFSKSGNLADLENVLPKMGKPIAGFGDKSYTLSWFPKMEMETFPEVGTHTLTFNLKQNDNQLAQKTLQIEVLPKYELKGLTATDANNTKRVAKAGETLYLVAKSNASNNNTLPSRKILYICKTSAPNNLFWSGEPYWKIDGNVIDKTGRNIDNTARNWPTLENYSQPSQNIIEAFAYENTLKVNVAWLRENKKAADVAPLGLKNALSSIQAGLDKFAKKLNTGNLLSIEAKMDVKFNDVAYNKEDNNSRNYILVRESGISGSISLGTGDIPIPGLSSPFPKYLQLGAYFNLSTSVSVRGAISFEKLCTANTFTLASESFALSGGGSLQVGVKGAILPGMAISAEIKGYASCGVNIAGKIKYQNNIFLYKFNATTSPLTLGYSIKATVKDWKLINYSKEVQLFNSMELGCIGNDCN